MSLVFCVLGLGTGANKSVMFVAVGVMGLLGFFRRYRFRQAAAMATKGLELLGKVGWFAIFINRGKGVFVIDSKAVLVRFMRFSSLI